MYELLGSAQRDLAEADRIYKEAQNHHGAGNADVNLAQIYLDLGNLEEAERARTRPSTWERPRRILADVPGSHRSGVRCECEI